MLSSLSFCGGGGGCMLCSSCLRCLQFDDVGVVGGLDWMRGGCRHPKSMCSGGG